MKGMPRWIRRWVKRVRCSFPECKVTVAYEDMSYVVGVRYDRGDLGWHYWGIRLNPSSSPAVRQNRKCFRDDFDYTLGLAIKDWLEATK